MLKVENIRQHIEKVSQMVTEPKIQHRNAEHYVAIPAELTMQEMAQTSQIFDQLVAWLAARDIQEYGKLFIRYIVIDMAAKMQLEFGAFLPNAIEGDAQVVTGVIPEGDYATLVYHGHYDGLYDANGQMVKWAHEHQVKWDQFDSDKGDGFISRLEIYVTDPEEEPDPAKWETILAFKVAE